MVNIFNPDQMELALNMKDPFTTWAKRYFPQKKLNRFLPRTAAYEDFKQCAALPKFKAKNFYLELRKWCLANDFELDPGHLKNSSGRIIRKLKSDEMAIATEMIYLKTKNDENS